MVLKILPILIEWGCFMDIKKINITFSKAVQKANIVIALAAIICLVPVAVYSAHPYFMAVELPSDTRKDIMALKDNMARHTPHLPGGCKVNFHNTGDLHITVVQLGETLSSEDLNNIRQAMGDVALHMKLHHHYPVLLKKTIESSKFEVWEKSPYLVFRLMEPGNLTDLARTVKSGLENRGIYVNPRMDYPDKAHTSIATYSGGSKMFFFIKDHYTSSSRAGDKVRIYPPKCSSDGRVGKIYLKKWNTQKECYENIDSYDF